jgi:hypothetical protein
MDGAPGAGVAEERSMKRVRQPPRPNRTATFAHAAARARAAALGLDAFLDRLPAGHAGTRALLRALVLI